MKKPSEIDFKSIGFGYIQTPYNVRCYYRDGKWGELEVSSSEYINMHMAATCLHYGQEAFEGLKAFNCKDGKIRLFRADENAKRLQSSAEHIKMAVPPVELFIEMCEEAIRLNKDYIPPFDSGGSLYLRPLLIGTGAQVGVKPSDEYLLIIFVTPVGSYFKGGMQGIKVGIDYDYDRAAPRGTGHVKVGGNYAASLFSGTEGAKKGYANILYVDPKEQKFLDEFGAANFFGIKGNSYVTPDSHTVLPSITNKSLQFLAEHELGMTVERRPIRVEELAEFTECGACGTAAVITPVESIDDPKNNKTYTYKWVGEKTQKLYDAYRAIQMGDAEDKYGWIRIVE